MHEVWQRIASAAGTNLSSPQLDQLEQYLRLLLDANQKINLTGIADPEKARLMHVADALTLLAHVAAEARDVADIGAGGGVLGIVLAIARPRLSVTLIEATRKKCAFLESAIDTLRLKNVRVAAARVETVADGARRESFDIAVARAVAELVWLAEWALPLLRNGGRLLAMKGPGVAAEIAAADAIARRLGGGKARVVPTDVPELGNHVIVTIEKIAPTPRQFPRDPTSAKGKPLR